jgi:glycosyltransferase involved in cell wall biosynthesis
MTRSPDVSIVVCTYNRVASLRLTLASLDAQQTPADLTWELVVVDNNSTDETRVVIEDFAVTARMPVRSLFVAEQGLSHARNAGVGASRGAIVGFTDDDVHPAPDWVARIATAIGRTGADMLGGRILPAWNGPPPSWLDDRSFHGVLAIMDDATAGEVLNAHRTPCVWGANMAFRREVFDRVGLFDTRLGLQGALRYGGEDTELVRRALAAGCRAVYDPTVLVWHRIGRDRMRIAWVSRVYFRRAEGEARVRPLLMRFALLGVPLALYRMTAVRVARWLTAVALRRPDRIQRWLDCCGAAGSMWGARKRRLDGTPAAPRSTTGLV